MNTRVSCITLPVSDLKKSTRFYRDGLGFRIEEKNGHAVIHLPNRLRIVLISRDEFSDYAKKLHKDIAGKGSAAFILTYYAEDNKEVDAIMAKAIKAGAKQPAPPAVESWGYAGYLVDPEGYIWEIIYNPSLL